MYKARGEAEHLGGAKLSRMSAFIRSKGSKYKKATATEVL